MSDILKKAIAEAKVLRGVAIDNAKHMLLESLDEKVEGILSNKLQQEMDGEEEELPAEDSEIEETDDPGNVTDKFDKKDQNVTPDLSETDDPGSVEDIESSTDPDVTPDLAEDDEIGGEEEEDLEFENILKELDDEMENEPGEEEDMELESLPGLERVPGPTDNPQDSELEEDDDMDADDEEVDAYPPVEENDDADEDDEEINIDELLDEDDDFDADDIGGDEDEEVNEEEYPSEGGSEDKSKEQQNVVKQLESVRAQNLRLKKSINIREKMIKKLTSQITEINLFNHKLAHTTRLFKKFNLSSGSKMKIIETFDRAKSIREVKLVYATLYESYRQTGSKRTRTIKSVKELNESSASKPTGGDQFNASTILTEGKDMVSRFDKLVNYNKR